MAEKNIRSQKDVVKKKQTNVDIINPECYQTLQLEAEKRGQSLRKYVNDILETSIDKEDFISRYLPQIKKIGFDEDLGEIYLRDSKISKSPTISKSDGVITCDTCDVKIKNNCVHVLFAMAQLEIGRLQLSRKKK